MSLDARGSLHLKKLPHLNADGFGQQPQHVIVGLGAAVFPAGNGLAGYMQITGDFVLRLAGLNPLRAKFISNDAHSFHSFAAGRWGSAGVSFAVDASILPRNTAKVTQHFFYIDVFDCNFSLK